MRSAAPTAAVLRPWHTALAVLADDRPHRRRARLRRRSAWPARPRHSLRPRPPTDRARSCAASGGATCGRCRSCSPPWSTPPSLLLQVPVPRLGLVDAARRRGQPGRRADRRRPSGTSLEWLVPVVFVTLLLPAAAAVRPARGGDVPARRRRRGDGRARRARRCCSGWSTPSSASRSACALALSVGGALLHSGYLRGYRPAAAGQRAACLESTRAHTAYNRTIVVLIVVLLTTGEA